MAAKRRLDFSPRGQARVALWTVLGTIGCTAFAVIVDSFNFPGMNSAELLRALAIDIAVPTALAAPLIFFFSSKLRELAIAHEKLTILASTDSLTEVLNRGAFKTLVDAYLEKVGTAETMAGGALLVVDADHFKAINDSYGHDRGDEALKLIAGSIKGVLREKDLVGRIGGEEFGVFLPHSSSAEAEGVAERIRRTIAQSDFRPDGVRRRLSVSVGGAVFDRPVRFEELFRAADIRLYEAKQKGRNQVALSQLRAA